MRRECYFYDTRDFHAFKCHNHSTVIKPLAVCASWQESGYQAGTRPSGKGNSAARAAHKGDFPD